jgi:hypothetical protein
MASHGYTPLNGSETLNGMANGTQDAYTIAFSWFLLYNGLFYYINMYARLNLSFGGCMLFSHNVRNTLIKTQDDEKIPGVLTDPRHRYTGGGAGLQ